MQYRLLLRGGTVVDGTGAAARRADVRIRDGLIVEVGPDLEAAARERVVDARGCYVTPGFIETHNHYDGPMWWSPTLDPLPGYGITTTINGNCGFSAAPASDDPRIRAEMVEIFSFFEDIPAKPFVEELPWSWRKWSEYKRALQTELKFPVNFAAYVGHIPIRLGAMGLEAWDRAATPSEIARMCELLEDALAAGALGLSTNLLDHDGHDRPVPSMLADDAEFGALLDVIARHPGATFQVILDAFHKMTLPENLDRMARLCGARGVRMQFLGVPNHDFQDRLREPMFEQLRSFKAQGFDIWPTHHHVPPTMTINFFSSQIFAKTNIFVWHELVATPTEAAKLALLEDPAWRERARISWEKSPPTSTMRRPEEMTLSESESGYGPVGVTLADYAAQRGGLHPSDALADWLLDNGVGSSVLRKPWVKNREMCIGLYRDPQSIANLTDSGAHGQTLCGIGDNIDFLTDYVRDSNDLTIEEAVHNLTGRIAGFFSLHDRGEIKPGRRADVVVFNLDEIERRPVERVYDVPDGEGGRTWRYSRPPAPMRLTLVNGVPTFDNGRFSGLFPGEVLAPVPQPLAHAAE